MELQYSFTGETFKTLDNEVARHLSTGFSVQSNPHQLIEVTRLFRAWTDVASYCFITIHGRKNNINETLSSV